MSIKSTHWISRKAAIEAIKKRIDSIEEMDNERLSEILEIAVNDMFMNFIVVDGEEDPRPSAGLYSKYATPWLTSI